MPNRFTPVPANTDQAQQAAIINNNFAQLDNENIKKIMFDSTGTPRIFFDGTNGQIKVAKEGFDVTTATDAQLAFNSDQNTLKVAYKGVSSVTSPVVSGAAVGYYSGQGTTVVPHTLGYPPIVLLQYGTVANGSFSQTPTTWITQSSSSYVAKSTLMWTAEADAIYFFIDVEMIILVAGARTISADTFDFTYYLLQESASSE